MAAWLDLEWTGKTVTFYAFKLQGAKDLLDVFKGAPAVTLGSVGGLWAGDRCLGGQHSTLGLVQTQHLMVRGPKRGGGPQKPPPPLPEASSP